VEPTVQTPCGELAVERPARVADPSTMVIFGATGDLAKRKLLPTLYNLNGDRLLPERFAAVGVGREPMTTDAYREKVSRDLQEFSTAGTKRVQCEWLESRLAYLAADFGDEGLYRRLGDVLSALNESCDLLDQLLLAEDVDRREQLVLVDRLQQLLVLVFTLILGVGERGNGPERTVEVELRRALLRQLEQFV
jgi:hypothetical protein